MGLFSMTQDERRAHVARCLDLDPSKPKDWPNEAIDRLLSNVEHLAERALFDDIMRFGSSIVGKRR